MILHSGKLPTIVDKEMLWTKTIDRGRDLNKLQELQIATFVNNNIMNILNNKSIEHDILYHKIQETRNCYNKYLFLKETPNNKTTS
jgi:hypothetical protein